MSRSAVLRRARASFTALTVFVGGCRDAPSEVRAETDPTVFAFRAGRPEGLPSDQFLAGQPAGFGVGPALNHAGIFFASPPVLPGALSICAYSESTARRECPTVRIGGVQLTRSFVLADAAGAPTTAFDATTDRVHARRHLAGAQRTTIVGSVEIGPSRTIDVTVNRASEDVVSGYASPDGRLRHDGTAAGTETEVVIVGRDTVRMERQFADTTRGLVVPGYMGRGPSGPWPNLPVAGHGVRVVRMVWTRRGISRTYEARVTTEFLENGVIRTTRTVNGVSTVCERPWSSSGMAACG